MAEWLGTAVFMLVMTRVALWLVYILTANVLLRIVLAYWLALIVGVATAAHGYADGGSPRYLYALALDGTAMLPWLALDLLTLYRLRLRIWRRLSGFPREGV